MGVVLQPLLLALVTASFLAATAVATRPPDVVAGGAGRPGVSPTTVTVMEGRVAKLPCPMQPATFVEFFYGSQLLATGTQVGALSSRSDAEMVRIDGSSIYLRIASARREQAGVYTCRVVNGFGTASVNVTLIVTDQNGVPFGDSHDRPTVAAGGSNSYAFNIVEPYPSNRTVSVGEKVILECHVRGPANIPGVVWYKELVDDAEDEHFVDLTTVLPAPFGSDYNIASVWMLVRPTFYSNTDMLSGQFVGRLTIPTASSRHAGRYLCSVSASRQPLYRLVTVSINRGAGGATAEDYLSDGGERPGAASADGGGSSWLTTVFGSYSATLAVVIAVPSVVLLLAAAAVIYAVNKRKREHRAVKAKLRHQSKMAGSSTADSGVSGGRFQQQQPHPMWPGGGVGSSSVDRGSGSSTAPLVAQQQQHLPNSVQPAASSAYGVAAPLLGTAGLCASDCGGQVLYYPADMQYSMGPPPDPAAGATPYQQLQYQLHQEHLHLEQRRFADAADDRSSDTQPSSSRHASSRGSDYPSQQMDAMYRYYGNS